MIVLKFGEAALRKACDASGNVNCYHISKFDNFRVLLFFDLVTSVPLSCLWKTVKMQIFIHQNIHFIIKNENNLKNK